MIATALLHAARSILADVELDSAAADYEDVFGPIDCAIERLTARKRMED